MPSEKLTDLVKRIAGLQARRDFDALLAEIAEDLGYNSAAYYRLTRFGAPLAPTPVFGGAFTCWLTLYAERNYALVDPVLPWVFRRDLPFSAREVEAAVPEPAQLHDDRRTYWAADGLFCPVAGSWGEVGAVCWGADTEILLSDADRLAMGSLSRALVTQFKWLAQEESLPDLLLRPLSRREVQCAYWLSQGERASGVARQLGLSIHTVRQYIDAACVKLSARNRGEMVSRASALGLIPEIEAAHR